MKKMSKTKLTYITPVLDFVQAESEGLLAGGTATTGDVDQNPEGDWKEEDRKSVV